MEIDNYIKDSIKTHLFFARILREHAIFMELAILDKDKDIKNTIQYFQNLFTDILNSIVSLSSGYITEKEKNEIITNNTLKAEKTLQKLSGINIDTSITEKENNSNFENILKDGQLIDKISSINRRTLPIIRNFIYLKKDILNRVDTQNIYIHYYNTMIKHFIEEEMLYNQTIENLQKQLKQYQNNNNLNISEYKLTKEHLEFIKDMTDPIEEKYIAQIKKYIIECDKLINNYSPNSNEYIQDSLKTITKIRNFSINEEEKITNCQIKSIMIPLYIDHTIREMNHIINKIKEKTN